MIYSVEIDEYSAYIDWELFSNFCIFGVQYSHRKIFGETERAVFVFIIL